MRLYFRLDFLELVLSPPDSAESQCLNDRLAVSGGSNTPVICGTSTGNHSKYEIITLYLEVSKPKWVNPV